MKAHVLQATIERQLWSRFRAGSYWVGAVVPVVLIGMLLFLTARANDNPAATLFLAVLSGLWVGGSTCVREIVDERKLLQREPHLSLLAYALAKIIHAAILAACQSMILTLFLKWSGAVMIPAAALWLILFLTTMSGSMLALILSAVCEEPSTALAWFPLLLVPQVVFGGFLFPYGATMQFAPSWETGRVIVIPDELARKPVDSTVLRAAGALTVSRWALEALAAHSVEQDLSDRETLGQAIQVANLVPLTLFEDRASETLYEYVEAVTGGETPAAPRVEAHRTRYVLLLLLFAAGQAALLVLILPARDPRRA